MDNNQTNKDQRHVIICVGRQIGCGGRVIARQLARQFDAQFYDRELLNLAAQESGFSAEFFEQNDEHKGFWRGFFHMNVPHLSDTSFYRSNFSQEALFQFQSDAIRKAAAEHSCVFVGRCADYVLRDESNVVNIFVTAPMDFRVAHVAERHHCDEATARRLIEKGEHERATYYNYYTGKRWGAAQSYDLCVDVSLLGIENTGLFIAQFVNQRFSLK